MLMSLATWRRVARVGFAASEDPEDGVLYGLRLQLKGSRLTATASNRYVVATNTVTVEADGEPKTWEGIVVARQALLVEKDVRSLERYRSRKDVPDDQIELKATITADSMEVTLYEDGSFFGPESVSRRMDLMSGTFPEVGDVYKAARKAKRPERDTVATANPDYLTTAGKTVDWEPSGITYLMPVPNSRHPLVCVSPADPDWCALVMPYSREGDVE